MLDMDFEKKINFIIFKIHSAKKKALAEPEPPRFRLDENGEPIEVEEQEAAKSATNRIDPQTILISATLTSGIKEIARRLNVVDAVHVDEPRHNNNSNQAIEVADKGKKNGDDEVDVDEIKKRVEVDSEEIVLPARLTHSYIVVPSKLRLVSLIAFILDKFIYNKTSSKTKMIIFASTNDSVQFHEIILRVFVNRKFSLYLDENNLSDVEEEDMNVDDDELVSGEGIDLDEANDDDDFELNIKKSSAAGKKPQAKGNKKQSKKSTKKSHTDLNKNNLIDVFALYGNMDQHKRAEILSKYCQSDSGLLICTDVAARGLDMPNIDWIVQFTPPTSRFDYVHRVGRSARVGHKGNGLIFLEPSEIDYLKELNKLNISIKELKLESVMECLNLEGKYYPRQMGDNLRYPRNEEECANSMQFYIEEFVETSEETHDQARKAYTSFVRSYSTYSTDLKGVFYVKNLHLGHVAKSFGLREAPSELKSSAIRSYSSHANDKDRIRRPPVNREKKEPESTESKSSASNNNRKQQQTFSKNTNFGSGFGGLLRNYKSVSEFDSGLSSTGMKPGRKQKRPSLAERMKSNKANSSNSNEKPKIKKIIKKNMDIFD